MKTGTLERRMRAGEAIRRRLVVEPNLPIRDAYDAWLGAILAEAA